MMKLAAFGLAACLGLGLSGASLADDLKATARFSGTALAFDLQGSYSNVTLTVSGPNRFHLSASEKSGAPTIDLRHAGPVDDGQYTYQLTAATDEKARVRTALDNGREGAAARAEPRKAASASGTFRIKDGVIVKRDPDAREPQQKRK